MKLLYNEKEFFCLKTELLKFKITLPLAKLQMVGSILLFLILVQTFFVRSMRFSSVSTCFVLLEVTFLFKFFSLLLKSVSFTKSAIAAIVAKIACLISLQNYVPSSY